MSIAGLLTQTATVVIHPPLGSDAEGNSTFGTPTTIVYPCRIQQLQGRGASSVGSEEMVTGERPTPDGDGTLVKATLYTDDALTVTGPNPVTTDADGNESSIKAAPGTYDAYVGGETIRIVILGDPAAVTIAGGTP